MSCFYPLPAIKYRDPLNEFKWKVNVGKRHERSSFSAYTDLRTGEVIEPFTIPCGKCIGCRLDYSRMWADRCVMESLCYDPDLCWFLTLTYDDNHLVTEKRSLVTEKGTLTLYPKDVQDFMKRLRSHWKRAYSVDNIRFYLCGEYGSETFRPHMHILIYGLPINDLVPYCKNELGHMLFKSDELTDVWSHGFVVVGRLTWETCAYTARYVLKKYKGMTAQDTFDHYHEAQMYPEFTRMSRSPGIGRAYYEQHKDQIYRACDGDPRKLVQSEIILPQGRVATPPKYFDKIKENDDPVFMTFLKQARKHVAELRQAYILDHTSLDEDAYFRLLEDRKKNSTKALTRFL